MIAALLLGSATAFLPWMTFERSPAFQGSVTVEVGTLRYDDDDVRYEFRRTVQQETGSEISWTNTKLCPQARSVLISAERLERPAVSVPFLHDNDIIVTADGVGYNLKAHAQYPGSGLDTIEFGSNVGTPLAKWVDDSLAALEPCWKTARVRD